MSVNYYDPIQLTEAVKLLKPVDPFTKKMFFNKEKTYLADTIAWELETATDGVASISRKNGVAKNVKQTTKSAKYTTLLSTFEKLAVDIDQFEKLKQLASFNPSDKKTSFDEYLKSLAEILTTRMLRRQEQFCMEAISTGKISAVIDGVTYEMDYGYVDTVNSITLASTEKFDNADCDPLAVIRKYSKVIAKRTGMAVDTIVMGEDVAEKYLTNAKVLSQLNNLNYNVGQLKPMSNSNLAIGGQLLQTLPNGTDIYEYVQTYTANDGTTKSMLDSKSIILTSSKASSLYNEFAYGVINRFDPSSKDFRLSQTEKLLAEIIKSPDNRSGIMQLEARFVPIIKSPDPIIVLKAY